MPRSHSPDRWQQLTQTEMERFYLSILAIFFFNIIQGQNIEQSIDSLMAKQSWSDKPGIEIFIKKKSEVLYHKAFGISDLESKNELEINSVYDIASVSKEFTAISILQLVERKQLELTDDIRKFIPDFPTQENIITIENLLTHTSGIKRHTNINWAENEASKEFKKSIDVINYFKQDSLDFPPNQRHSYVNMNYILLGHIIEKISGKTYEEYIRKNIFEPLNMSNTFFPKVGQNITNKPKGYETENNQFVLHRPHSYTQSKGPGAIHSTAKDLAKWYEGLSTFKVISKESLYKAWQPYKVNNIELSNYGYGFYTDKKFGKLTVFHNGFTFGYSTSDLYFPEDDLLILVFSNVSDINTINTNTIIFDIASSIYQNAVPKLTAEMLDSYVGSYKMEEGFGAKVYREGMQLLISVDGGKADKLFPETKTQFMVKDFPAKAEFIPSSNGGKMGIVLSMGPNRFSGTKE
ncbi:MAG: serine hydrolase [Muriicola sp.]